jgi:hypothetical protein
MSLSGNRGEWSEIYALFKLLADGKVFAGDGNLKKYENLFFHILKIIRTAKNTESTYSILSSKKSILVTGKQKEFIIPQTKFEDMAKLLFSHISKQKKKGSLSFPDIENFMHTILCHSLKAPSKDKADIHMIIHDLRTNMEPKLGFSIKSKLGGNSTLINTSGDNSNFVYSVSNINDNTMTEFNSKKFFKDKFAVLQNKKAIIKFNKIKSKTFYNNLVYLDSCLPQLIAEALLCYYGTDNTKVNDIASYLETNNPLNFDISVNMDFYAHKLKQLLLTYACGMTSLKTWNGKYDANGGYLVVKEDGDVLCYHFYDRNQLEDYLFYNTKFDTPSTTKHKHGKIYKVDNNYYLNLNILVRFIH